MSGVNRMDTDIIKLLQKLRDDGSLKLLLTQGVIAYIPMLYIDIVEQYDILLKKGESKMDALVLIGDKFQVNQRVVYRALNCLKYEYRSFTPDERGRPRRFSQPRY